MANILLYIYISIYKFILVIYLYYLFTINLIYISFFTPVLVRELPYRRAKRERLNHPPSSALFQKINFT